MTIRSISAVVAMLCIHSVVAQPRFEASSPLVLVPVTVTDKKGAPIDGLREEEFVLNDDGERRTIHVDTSDEIVAPISVVIAVQSSSISSAALAKINKVGAMIQPFIAGEHGAAAVIAFDDEIRNIQEFTGDASKIRDAFRNIHGRSGASARMLDAVVEGVGMLGELPKNHRRILIVLSEARDRSSKTKLADAIERVQRANTVVYPATYSAYLTPWTAKPEDNPPTDGSYLTGLADLLRLGRESTADALARASGGLKISFNTLGALEKALERVSMEIHSQYLLSFAPPESEAREFRRIEVSIPSRPDAVVRARTGYWPR